MQVTVGLLSAEQGMMRLAAKLIYAGLLPARHARPIFQFSLRLGRLAFRVLRNQTRQAIIDNHTRRDNA